MIRRDGAGFTTAELTVNQTADTEWKMRDGGVELPPSPPRRGGPYQTDSDSSSDEDPDDTAPSRGEPKLSAAAANRLWVQLAETASAPGKSHRHQRKHARFADTAGEQLTETRVLSPTSRARLEHEEPIHRCFADCRRKILNRDRTYQFSTFRDLVYRTETDLITDELKALLTEHLTNIQDPLLQLDLAYQLTLYALAGQPEAITFILGLFPADPTQQEGIIFENLTQRILYFLDNLVEARTESNELNEQLAYYFGPLLREAHRSLQQYIGGPYESVIAALLNRTAHLKPKFFKELVTTSSFVEFLGQCVSRGTPPGEDPVDHPYLEMVLLMHEFYLPEDAINDQTPNWLTECIVKQIPLQQYDEENREWYYSFTKVTKRCQRFPTWRNELLQNWLEHYFGSLNPEQKSALVKGIVEHKKGLTEFGQLVVQLIHTPNFGSQSHPPLAWLTSLREVTSFDPTSQTYQLDQHAIKAQASSVSLSEFNSFLTLANPTAEFAPSYSEWLSGHINNITTAIEGSLIHNICTIFIHDSTRGLLLHLLQEAQDNPLREIISHTDHSASAPFLQPDDAAELSAYAVTDMLNSLRASTDFKIWYHQHKCWFWFSAALNLSGVAIILVDANFDINLSSVALWKILAGVLVAYDVTTGLYQFNRTKAGHQWLRQHRCYAWTSLILSVGTGGFSIYADAVNNGKWRVSLYSLGLYFGVTGLYQLKLLKPVRNWYKKHRVFNTLCLFAMLASGIVDYYFTVKSHNNRAEYLKESDGGLGGLILLLSFVLFNIVHSCFYVSQQLKNAHTEFRVLHHGKQPPTCRWHPVDKALSAMCATSWAATGVTTAAIGFEWSLVWLFCLILPTTVTTIWTGMAMAKKIGVCCEARRYNQRQAGGLN